MSYLDNERAREQRRRWTRENAHLYIRPDADRFIRHDAHRFMRPDAPGWVHPDAKLFDPFFRYRPQQPEQVRAAPVISGRRPDAAPVAPALSERRALERPRPTIADSCGPSLGELLKLKSEGAALRLQLAVIRQEIAAREARGLAPLRDSDPDWQAFLRNLARHQDGCRKAGFNPDQPRVPAGNPGGGQWTSGGGAGGGGGNTGGGNAAGGSNTNGGITDPRILSDATPGNDWRPGAEYAQSRYEVPARVPPTASIDENIRLAEGHRGNFLWFYNQVKNGGPWDYKQIDKNYEQFGNFNYGATGAAAGFSEATLLRAAGWANVRAGNSHPGWGNSVSLLEALLGIGGSAPFGDDPEDQRWISKGIRYYRATRGK